MTVVQDAVSFLSRADLPRPDEYQIREAGLFFDLEEQIEFPDDQMLLVLILRQQRAQDISQPHNRPGSAGPKGREQPIIILHCEDNTVGFQRAQECRKGEILYFLYNEE